MFICDVGDEGHGVKGETSIISQFLMKVGWPCLEEQHSFIYSVNIS